jgi:hypothetical protein
VRLALRGQADPKALKECEWPKRTTRTRQLEQLSTALVQNKAGFAGFEAG